MTTVLLLFAALFPAAFAADSEGAPATMQVQVQGLTVVKRVAPAWPSGVATDPAAGGVACRVAVRIDGSGTPVDVAVSGCELPFATETQRAIGEWRWSAWDSVAERRVTLNVRFPTPSHP